MEFQDMTRESSLGTKWTIESFSNHRHNLAGHGTPGQDAHATSNSFEIWPIPIRGKPEASRKARQTDSARVVKRANVRQECRT